jgi:phage terminase small subunit
VAILKNQRHELFAQGIVSGKSATKAYIAAGYSKNGAGQSAEKLLKNTEISARITELSSRVEAGVVKRLIASSQARQDAYQDLYDRQMIVITERAADMAGIPGGSSGMMVRQLKKIGSGEDAEVIEEYAYDTGLSKELRGTLQQMAQERGEWLEKKELTGKDGGAILIDDARQLLANRIAGIAARAGATGAPAKSDG